MNMHTWYASSSLHRINDISCRLSYHYLVSNYFNPEILPKRGVWYVLSIYASQFKS